MAYVGVIFTVTAKALKDVNQTVLFKFEIEYETYKNKIDNMNRVRDAAGKIDIASIRECMDPVMRHCLCTAGQIDGAIELKDATDEAVKKWFDEKLADSPEDMKSGVRAAMNSVRYVSNKKDQSGGVLRFFVKVIAALDKKNASSMVQDKDTCKSLITKIIEKLEPAELRERLYEDPESWTFDQRSDMHFVLKRMRGMAEDVAQGENAREPIKRRKPWAARRNSKGSAEQETL